MSQTDYEITDAGGGAAKLRLVGDWTTTALGRLPQRLAAAWLARAGLDGAFRPNWRPGMGGNAKIDVGDRSPLWIMTHRTVRFLREFFWI